METFLGGFGPFGDSMVRGNGNKKWRSLLRSCSSRCYLLSSDTDQNTNTGPFVFHLRPHNEFLAGWSIVYDISGFRMYPTKVKFFRKVKAWRLVWIFRWSRQAPSTSQVMHYFVRNLEDLDRLHAVAADFLWTRRRKGRTCLTARTRKSRGPAVPARRPCASAVTNQLISQHRRRVLLLSVSCPAIWCTWPLKVLVNHLSKKDVSIFRKAGVGFRCASFAWRAIICVEKLEEAWTCGVIFLLFQNGAAHNSWVFRRAGTSVLDHPHCSLQMAVAQIEKGCRRRGTELLFFLSCPSAVLSSRSFRRYFSGAVARKFSTSCIQYTCIQYWIWDLQCIVVHISLDPGLEIHT